MFCLGALALRAQVTLELAEVLRNGGAYAGQYAKSVSLLVLEEQYTQDLWTKSTSLGQPQLKKVSRILRSDLALLPDAAAGWVAFRDVYDVDGKPVRDRDDRVVKLFLQPNTTSMAQAKRIAAEGSRFNLPVVVGGREVVRTLNTPMTAFRFIETVNQPRSTFKLKGTETVDGVRAVVVQFDERQRPRMIASADDAPASGRLWVEPESGRIVRSELFLTTSLGSVTVNTTIRATFGPAPNVQVWVPRTMDEECVAESDLTSATLTGHATYSNVRQFSTDVRTPALRH